MNLPNKKYNTIVIDPPWNINSVSNTSHLQFKFSDSLPYSVMSDNELRSFPLNDFAEDDCQLFLWVTHSTLLFGLELLKIWGFKYHCLITWDKMQGVTICGVCRKTELVLYAYKGHQILKLKGVSLPTVFRENRAGHSVKPKLFYELLLKSTPEPRIDIFARKKHYGFDAWGNQVDETPTLESYNEND